MSNPVAGDDGAMPPPWNVPDDARDLEADLLALRRERAAARHWRQPGGVRRRFHRYGAPGFIAVLVLLGFAALVGGLLVAAPVGLPTGSTARPLSSSTARPGSPGALLPAVTLRVGQQDRPARALRPAVLALLPPRCGCAPVLRDLAVEAAQYSLPVVLVPGGDDPELPALLRAAAATRSYFADDPSGALTRAYAARGLTVLLVRADGVVTTVVRQVDAGRRFGAALSELGA